MTQSIEDKIHDFLRRDFSPRFGQVHPGLDSNVRWEHCRNLGTELWLDTGNADDIAARWTQQFSAVTTNNTLLNKEIQSGRYDELIQELAGMLDEYELDQKRKKLEFALALNAYHALRLVEKFDAYVSVEEHTDLAHDIQSALAYARRYFTICPERFIVKIPFTPAGLLATRKAAGEGIPINHTLGFSARQNYLITRIAGPTYVNVFLGRLNAVVSDNGLGSGENVGERAALASHAAVKELRNTRSAPSRQIAASLRDGKQVASLVGIDVITMPPRVAGQFIEMDIPEEKIADRTGEDLEAGIDNAPDIGRVGLDSLWAVPDRLVKCVDKLEKESLDEYSSDKIIDFFRDNDCGDIMVRWSWNQINASREEGKIPRLENWKDGIVNGKIGIDGLMNLAGLCSFSADQDAMDRRIQSVLEKNRDL
jgi:transaldolase